MVTEGSSFYNAEWQSKSSKKRKDESNGADGSAPKGPKEKKTKPAKVDPKAVVDSDEDSVSDKDDK